jgi:hypothetical protein
MSNVVKQNDLISKQRVLHYCDTKIKSVDAELSAVYDREQYAKLWASKEAYLDLKEFLNREVAFE